MLDTGSPQDQFLSAARRVAELAQEFENLPYPQLREKGIDLLRAVDTLHRTPLERLVALLRASGSADLLDKLSEDPILRQLLILYDLLPSDDRTTVEAALCSFHDYAHAHGGEIEIEDVVEGIVSLRIAGACLGCSRSTTSLHNAIEEALRREYPGFRSLEIREAEPSAGLSPHAIRAEGRPCA